MGGQSEPLVSVVTPVYNGASYLKECIESVLAQTYSNWEYIIVNNCSTDETLQIAEEYARKEKRVQVHNNERFQEIIANHNCGTRIFQILSYERTHAESQSSASQQINCQLPQNLSDLLQYGPSYLSKDELERQVCETLKFYHRFLAVNYFVGSKGKDFWDYHKGRLRELGYPLTPFALLKAGVLTVVRESVNPGQAIAKLWKHLFPAPTRSGIGAAE